MYFPWNDQNKEGRYIMKHIFQQGKDATKPTLLLLHGTGGTEEDLLPLAEQIDPTASVLSVRGNIIENGMPRFFRRLAEGVFDEEDLIFRTKELNDFLNEAADKYQFNRQNMMAVGYSNGANIAGSLLFHYENLLKGAILHHPMVPRRDIELPNLKNSSIFITAGKNDPMCPPEEAIDLEEMLKGAEANVELFWTNGGHQLVMDEVVAAKRWYEKQL